MHKMSPLPSGEIERSETHRVERSEMHSRVRLKIPPEAGVRGNLKFL